MSPKCCRTGSWLTPTANGHCWISTCCPTAYSNRKKHLSFCNHMNTFCTMEQGPRSSRLCSHGLRNEALVAQTLLLLFWKTQPNWNRFQTNFLQMKGENSITSYGINLTFKMEKIWWLVKEILVFWSIEYTTFMHDDSEHKVDDSDDRWMLDPE